MLIVLIFISLFICVISKKVPDHTKETITCQCKDFFELYFYCNVYDTSEKLENHVKSIDQCTPFQKVENGSAPLFLLYDVNSVEGFNLRRDVYVRLAVFIKSLRQRKHFESTVLVLPPFYQLYHWNIVSYNQHTINGINTDDILFWNHFFDLESMKRYTAVIDIYEYFTIIKDCFGMNAKSILDYVFRLKYFDSMFLNRKFEEKFEVQTKCDQNLIRNSGQFISLYKNVSIRQFNCVEFQGSAALLSNLMEKYTNR